MQEFHDSGFLVIEDFFDAQTLLEHTLVLLKKESGPLEGDFFLDSSDKIRVFVEDGIPVKIGHAVHKHPEFLEISKSEKMQKLCRDLGFTDPRILQSMIILKNPQGPAVPNHIDSTFLYTNPLSCIGFWFC
jgi:phytanoyl-CoA hydroxylase